MLITHIVPRLNPGGPGNNLLTSAKYHRKAGFDVTHQIITLEKNASLNQVRKALKSRIRVHIAPPIEEIWQTIEESDIVNFSYWNCPSAYLFLSEIGKVPSRLIVTSHTNGLTLPQVLPPQLLNAADHCLLTSRQILPRLSQEQANKCTWHPAIIDPPPFHPDEQKQNLATGAVRIFYAGTLNYFKMHPAFMDLHVDLPIPSYQVEIYGSGGLEEAMKLEISGRGASNIHLKGFADNFWDVLREQDILSYPLHPNTYSSSDKVMQEAMWAGIPIVALAGNSMSEYVAHGETGILANNTDEYRAALTELATDNDLRKKMGKKALQKARDSFAPEDNALWSYRVYEKLMLQEKRTKSIQVGSPREFLNSLGTFYDVDYDLSKRSLSDLQTAKGDDLSRYKDYFMYACEGGMAQYLNAFGKEAMEK